MYRTFSNRRCPRILAAQSEGFERNRRRPQIVATASKRGTCTCVQMISDDASARTACVAQVVPTADSRTERLRVLLTASSNHYRFIHMYLIQPSLMSVGFPKK